MPREVKVGLLVVVAFAVLGAGVFLVSERQNLFSLKNRYHIQFQTVGGLAQGSPVQLDGVTVGSVERIVLPERVEQKWLTVWVTADRRYAERIRGDSLARIKTLGLLGDKYIDITSGSIGTERIPADGLIPAAPPTDVERLIATGGDAVDNVVAISYSLRTILERMEAGEGILGELTTDNEAGKRAKEALISLLETAQRITAEIERGEGTLALLLRDDALASKLERSVDSLDGLLVEVTEGDGVLPTLLTDSEARRRFEQLIDNAATASSDVNALLEEIRAGDGLLGRMIHDEEFSRQLTEELQGLVQNLRVVSERLAEAEGTLGLLIADPQVYEAMNDIIVGIDESSILRWLVRNRQKKGIEKRYEAEQERLQEERASDSGIGSAGDG